MEPDEFLNRLLSSPEQTWPVPANAAVQFGDGANPFDGMTITAWAADE